MFYLLNFENHQFITCNNVNVAEAKIRGLLAAGCPKDSLEVVDASDVDGRMEVDAFRTLCEEQGWVDHSAVDLLVEKEARDRRAVLPVRKPAPSIDLWARLGISLGVTPEELDVLKGGGMAAQDLFVDLVRSDRCEMSGETYFPAECNEEYLGDIDGELEFDLGCALHDNEARQAREFSSEKIEAAKQCFVDNGIEADEAETVLQALGYVLLDRELFPRADVGLGFYEASIFEASSGKYLADEHQGQFELGPKDERLLFYDEADAERVLALLNEVSDLSFVLIDERIQEKDNTIIALDDAIASAEKVSGAQEITESIDDRER